MMSTGLSGEEHFDFCTRPKRQRLEGSKHYDVNGSGPKCLELEGVISVLKEYDDYDGGINCSMCGEFATNDYVLEDIVEVVKTKVVHLSCSRCRPSESFFLVVKLLIDRIMFA